MFYSKQYNQYVMEGTAFILGDVQYPSNFLNLSTAEEKASIGLVEVQIVGAPENEQFYWVSTTLNDGVMTYVNTPKDLADLKEAQLQKIKTTAYSLLFPSDWMVIRAAEGTPVPAEWSSYRAAVRAMTNKIKDEIDLSFDIDSLIASVSDIQWPHDPNYVPPVEDTTPADGAV